MVLVINTLQDVMDDTMTRLNEARDSSAGALTTAGGASVAPTSDVLTRLTNECLADLCRTGGLVIPDAGAGTTAANTPFVPYFSLTVASGNVLWAARDVAYAGALLRRVGPGLYASKYNAGVAAGTPAEWAYQGTEGIALGPVPTGAGALSVRGLATPKPLTLVTDAITPFLPPDRRRYLSFWNAYYVAIKNKEDATLLSRAADWRAEYERGKQELLTRLLHMDPATYAAFYGQGAAGAAPGGGGLGVGDKQ